MKINTKKILIAAGVFLTVLISGITIYRTYLTPDAIRNLAQKALEARFQKKVVINKFEVDFLNQPRITVGQISMGIEGGYAMQASSMIARFSPWYLLIGRLEIKDVTINNPQFTIDFEKLNLKGPTKKIPTIIIHQGNARLIYKTHAMDVSNIQGFIGRKKVSLDADTLGGTIVISATNTLKTWRGKATAGHINLSQLDSRYQGISGMDVTFSKHEGNYDFSADLAGENLKLPWMKSLRRAKLTLDAEGNERVLILNKVALKSSLIDARGNANVTGIKDPLNAHIDLKLESNEFIYEDMVAALPTEQFPDWLHELLTVNIRGGRSKVKLLRYQGTLNETTFWDKCLKNLQVNLSINGQNFSVINGPRVNDVTGLFAIGNGSMELKDLSGLMNSSRIKMVNVKFPDFVSRGLRIAVEVDTDMPASDFLLSWRACVPPQDVREFLDPINAVEAGRIQGNVWFYYEDISNTAVIKGNAVFKDVSMNWDKASLRHVSGEASAGKYRDPIAIKLGGELNEMTIDSLKISLREPFQRQIYTFDIDAHGLPLFHATGSDRQGASIQMTGSGQWPNIRGDLGFRAQEINFFNYQLQSGISGTCKVKTGFSPEIPINISNLVVNLKPDELISRKSLKKDVPDVSNAAQSETEKNQTLSKPSPVPADGNITGTLNIETSRDFHMTGQLDFKQAGFLYEDKPLTVDGLIIMRDDQISSEALKIRHDQTTVDMNGTLSLGHIPYFKGNVLVDRLNINAGERNQLDLVKKVQGDINLRLTNLNYHGVTIQKASAHTEIGSAGLKLTNLDLSDEKGTVKGMANYHPDGNFEYDLDIDVHNFPADKFIAATWPSASPWMDGKMDLKGRSWGSNTSMNGDVSFKAKDGRIRRYNLLSRIFSFLNPYKIFATGEFGFLQSGFPYNTISSNFSIRDSVVTFNDFYLSSNSLQISAIGKYIIPTHDIDMIMGIEPLQTFDKTITQVPIVGWLLTGKKGVFIIISLHVTGKIEDSSVSSMAAGSLTKTVADSLLRILNLPLDLIKKPGDVILPGIFK